MTSYLSDSIWLIISMPIKVLMGISHMLIFRLLNLKLFENNTEYINTQILNRF